MAVAPWISWTDQQEALSNTAFPGQAAQTDLVNPVTSIPSYTTVPVGINAVDPFAGWTALKEAQTNTGRPAVTGLT